MDDLTSDDFPLRALDVVQQAVLEHDRPALEGLVSARFRAVGGEGMGVIARARWLELAAEIDWHSFEVVEHDVRRAGPLAVVVARVRQAAAWSGTDIGGDFAVVDIWDRLEGRWQLVTRHVPRLG